MSTHIAERKHATALTKLNLDRSHYASAHDTMMRSIKGDRDSNDPPPITPSASIRARSGDEGGDGEGYGYRQSLLEP